MVENDDITYGNQYSVQTADESGWDILRNAIRHPNGTHKLLSRQTSSISSNTTMSTELGSKTLRACNSYVKGQRSQSTSIIRNIALILVFCALISVLAGIGITLYYRIIGDDNIREEPQEKEGIIIRIPIICHMKYQYVFQTNKH